jgi:hypothetical protein
LTSRRGPTRDRGREQKLWPSSRIKDQGNWEKHLERIEASGKERGIRKGSRIKETGKTPGEDRGIWKGARNQERIEGNLEQDQIWSITAVRSRSSDTNQEGSRKDRGIGEATRDLDKHLERILEKHWKGLKKREGAEIGKFNLS